MRGIVAEHGLEAEYAIHRWHPEEERWEPEDVGVADRPRPSTRPSTSGSRQDEAEESEELGEALWEVRIEFDSHRDAVAMADRIESEADDLLAGYTISVVRHWKYLLIGADNEDQAHADRGADPRRAAPRRGAEGRAERGARLAGGEAEPVCGARRSDLGRAAGRATA